MSDHTPDQAIEIHGSFQVIATEHGPVYACQECQHRFPDAKPYAHLTAMQRAAPDMYEALKAAKLALEHAAEVTGMNFPALRLEIDAALAKAEEA